MIQRNVSIPWEHRALFPAKRSFRITIRVSRKSLTTYCRAVTKLLGVYWVNSRVNDSECRKKFEKERTGFYVAIMTPRDGHGNISQCALSGPRKVAQKFSSRPRIVKNLRHSRVFRAQFMTSEMFSIEGFFSFLNLRVFVWFLGTCD